MLGHVVGGIFQKLFVLPVLLLFVIRYGCIQASLQPGPFTVNIQRSFQNTTEEQLIEIAESVCPNPADVAASCLDSEAGDGCRWWCSDPDSIAIPYAITGEAVQYYVDLVHKFENAAVENPQDTGALSATVSYCVGIEHYDVWTLGEQSFNGVYVVSMELNWSYFCGPLCATGVDMSRVVVLDPDGHVLSVSDDGEPHLWVS